jgi:hypothetical protein
MANRQRQGWSADPFGLHEERYFSAGRATKLVRDGKVESYDDPPSETYQAPDDEAEAEEARPVFRAGVSGQYGPGPGVPKRSIARLLAAAAAIIAATVLAVVVLVKQESPATSTPGQGPAVSQAAYVSQSAERTLAQRTADMTLNGTVQVAGRTVAVNGTGQIDFSTNAMAFDATILGPGPPLSEKVILVGGNLYLAASLGGTGQAAADWTQLPASEWGAENVVGSDPMPTLLVLEQEGVSVRALGTRSVDGVSCTGYAVTPSKQAMIEAARTQAARLGYSAAVTGELLSQVQGTSPPTVTVWFDAQGLLRETSENLSVPAGGSSAAASGSVVIDFSNFGSPVRITAPTSAVPIGETTGRSG